MLHGMVAVQMYRELVRDVNMARAEICKMESGFEALQAESQVAWMRGRMSSHVARCALHPGRFALVSCTLDVAWLRSRNSATALARHSTALARHGTGTARHGRCCVVSACRL